jgi:hypothetical protein
VASAYDIDRLLSTLVCYKWAIEEFLGDLIEEDEALEIARTFMHIQQLGGKTPDAGLYMKGPEIHKAREAAGLPDNRPKQIPKELQQPMPSKRLNPSLVTPRVAPGPPPVRPVAPPAGPAPEPIDDSVAPFPIDPNEVDASAKELTDEA